ncbi:hypothetical protein Q3G72_027764 [Acer saccharum]|nr:hypothetical protein Q3G72_027764 [Acer saccharum]
MAASRTSSSISLGFNLEEGERSNSVSNLMGIGGGGYGGSGGDDRRGGGGRDGECLCADAYPSDLFLIV